MSIEHITVETNCVAWKNIQLPHAFKSSIGPGFCFDGFDWNFEVLCYMYADGRGYINRNSEWWEFYLTCSSTEKSPDSYSVILYTEAKGKYVHVGQLVYKKDCEKSERSSSVYRSALTEIFGSESDTITVLFLFSRHTLNRERKFKETAQGRCEDMDSDKKQTSCSCMEGLSKDIRHLFNKDDEYSDATLQCGDKNFHVHRNILAARSEVFSAMFKHDMSERNSGVVEIVDLDPCILEQFLIYLYCGKIEQMSMNTALELYQAANKYSVHTLKQFSASFILDNLSEDIIYEVLLLADKAGDVEFLDGVASFAAKITGFLKSDEWKNFAVKFPNIALKVYFKYHN